MYNTDFIRHDINGVIFMSSALFDAQGLRHAFSTRHGGVSRGAQASLNLDHKKDTVENVRQNHLRLAQAVGYNPETAVSTHQIHSDIIRLAQPEDAGRHLNGPTPYECDALITAKTVQRLQQEFQIAPADCLAAIGPGIGGCCFSTHADVPQAMRRAFGDGVEQFIQSDAQAAEPGKFLVDLKAINAWRLRQAGLKSANIAISPECTCCLPEKYWSHRFTRGERGGQAAVISL